MAYIGQFTQYQRLYASELNTPFPACVMTATTTLAVPTATVTGLSYTAAQEVFDPLGWHADGAVNIYPTITGLYLVESFFVLDGAGGTGAYISVGLNGTTTIAQSAGDLSGTAATSSLSVSVVYKLTSTDFISTAAFQNSGVSRNITRRSTSVVFLGVA